MPDNPDLPPGDQKPSEDKRLPQARIVSRERISAVWLLPLIALLIGGWLAYKAWSERGPTIHIELPSAAGLQAGKTKVKLKDVEIGTVTSIDVTRDLSRIIVTAELRAGTEPYLTNGTRFWVARPRVTASGVSGLETLLSGVFVAMDPSLKGKPTREFVGLTEPPVITMDAPGAHYRLRAERLGSLNLGSPVYFRNIPVGQVTGYALDADGAAVSINIFIAAPHNRRVFRNTRFWNASGIDLHLTADGIRLDSEALASVLIGGIAFDLPKPPETPGPRASADETFQLHSSREQAYARISRHRERYLMRFNGSVRGLTIGAPVVLRGIEIGRVLDVRLELDEARQDFAIPVLVELELDRIGTRTIGPGQNDTERRRLMERLVEAGLRGQLKSGSLLTGQLFIELDFDASTQPNRMTERDGHPVIPTVPAPLDAITTRLANVLGALEAIPIDQIGADLGATLAGTRALVESAALGKSLDELAAALAALRGAATRLDVDIVPQLSTALDQVDDMLANANQLLAPNAPLSSEAKRMMREISAAARSIRTTADYLARHPESLVRGKPGGR